MVTPETPEPVPPRRRKPWAVAVGLLGLFGALAAIVALTEPAPPPTADATTTTIVVEAPTTTAGRPRVAIPDWELADIVTGAPVAWIEDEWFMGRQLIDAVVRDGAFYMFTTNKLMGANPTIETWVSRRFAEWEHVGSFEAVDFEPFSVVGGGAGFVLLGFDPAREIAAWVSPDGGEWERTDIPLPESADVPFIGATGATDDLIVLVTEEFTNPFDAAVRAAVAERHPGFSGLFVEDWNGVPRVLAMGPLGLTLAPIPPDDLGIDPARYTEEWGYQMVAYASKDGGRSWQRREFVAGGTSSQGIGSIYSLFEGPDGLLWARGTSPEGADRFLTTSDGMEWSAVDVEVPSSTTPESILPWGDRYVGWTWTRGLPIVTASDDLHTWTPILRPDVPGCCPQWGETFSPDLAVGPSGVALTLRRARVEVEFRVPALTRDGYRLEAPPEGDAVLYRGSTVIHRIGDLAGGDPVRSEGNSIVFLDPGTGEDLVSFSMEELNGLQEERYEAARLVVQEDDHALFFSPDGENWTIQDLGELVIGNYTTRMVIGEGRVLLLATSPAATVARIGLPPTSDGYR